MDQSGGIVVRLLKTAREEESLIELFEVVAAEEGWQPGNQLRAFPEISVYFGAFLDGELVGGLQLVSPDMQGALPCQALWPDSLPCSCGGVGEVTVFAVHRAFRGRTDLFWPVCVELWRHCMVSGMQALVIEATPKMLTRYRRIGWPLEVIGDLRPHWGEDCYLARIDMRAAGGCLLELGLRSASFRALTVQAIRPTSRSGCADVKAVA